MFGVSVNEQYIFAMIVYTTNYMQIITIVTKNTKCEKLRVRCPERLAVPYGTSKTSSSHIPLQYLQI